MVIYRLVLTNGVVITLGESWPGPDGLPMASDFTTLKDPATQTRLGHVYKIVFVPERFENSEDDEGIGDTDPAHYEVLMRADDGGGLKTADGSEETLIYTFYTDQIRFVGKLSGWIEALAYFGELVGGSDVKFDLQPGNSEKQAQPEAST